MHIYSSAATKQWSFVLYTCMLEYRFTQLKTLLFLVSSCSGVEIGEQSNRIFMNLSLEKVCPNNGAHHWMPMEGDDDENDNVSYQPGSIGSSMEDSKDSTEYSSCCSDLAEDASSPPSPTLLSQANGPLYELSELMAQLPIKRGLSKFYQGKSQSYKSLASVKSVEDLAKKVMNPCGVKMKTCKRNDWGSDYRQKSCSNASS